MSAFITDIGTANPAYKIAQDKIAAFMTGAHQLRDGEIDKLTALYRATGIQYRYSVIEDYGVRNGASFFPKNEALEPFPTTSSRMKLYQEKAIELSLDAIARLKQFDPAEVTHLITVSCTGMYAPGLDIDLVKQLGLSSSVERTAINYMGCYAAFNAIKTANALCTADHNAVVLIVCTELCSIHFQKAKHEDNFLANALFGDGSAAVTIKAKPTGEVGLKISSSHCDILPDGERDMAWEINDFGFQMKLSTYVPEVIKNGIGSLTAKLLQDFNLEVADVKYLAIHPGGKKILQEIEQVLNFDKERNKYAYHVLRQYGNMSSPTVLFVINEIWQQLQREDNGEKILSFAFGPGLTLEGMLLEIARQ